MQSKLDDISKIIKEQIKHYSNKTEQDEIGYVISVGDGISKVHGIDKCKANELLVYCVTKPIRTAGYALCRIPIRGNTFPWALL